MNMDKGMNTLEQAADKAPNVLLAGNDLGRLFVRFVEKIDAKQRQDFFHPINRDAWLTALAQFLEAQINPDFPSND